MRLYVLSASVIITTQVHALCHLHQLAFINHPKFSVLLTKPDRLTAAGRDAFLFFGVVRGVPPRTTPTTTPKKQAKRRRR